MSILSDIDFQNLILDKSIEKSRFHGLKDGEAGLIAPDANVMDDLSSLYGVVTDVYSRSKDDIDFKVTFDRRDYRVTLIKEGVYTLRRAATSVPTLRKCGIHSRVAEYLLGLEAGVVLIIGAFSSGKTTAASSYLVEFARRRGGLCLTLEDPPELPLEGDYGKGRIYQISTKRSEIETRVQDIMRATFSAALISEIRSGIICHAVLQAGSAGRVVVSTGHGEDIPDALERIANFSSGRNTSGNAGAKSNLNLLADSLRAVIKMKQIEPGHYGATSYLITGAASGACIRSGEFKALQNHIDYTMSVLSSASPKSLIYG